MKVCTVCDRYVQMHETSCPFCASEKLAREAAVAGEVGMSRARVFAARAAITGVVLSAAVACGEEESPYTPLASGGAAATGGAVATNSGGATASGAGGAGLATGGSIASGGTIVIDEAGGEGGESADVLIYGGPFPDMMKARV